MNAAAENTFRMILANGIKLEYAPRFDRRVAEVDVDGHKFFCRSEKAAREIASEINAWTCSSQEVAWQLGYAVVFWKP